MSYSTSDFTVRQLLEVDLTTSRGDKSTKGVKEWTGVNFNGN
jgi:hypothetical protein